MSTQEFLEARRVWLAQRAATPAAIAKAKAVVVDFDGSQIADGASPVEGLTAGEIRTLLFEIDRLQKAVAQHAEDMKDADRQARDAYSEGRYDEQEKSRDYY